MEMWENEQARVPSATCADGYGCASNLYRAKIIASEGDESKCTKIFVEKFEVKNRLPAKKKKNPPPPPAKKQKRRAEPELEPEEEGEYSKATAEEEEEAEEWEDIRARGRSRHCNQRTGSPALPVEDLWITSELAKLQEKNRDTLLLAYNERKEYPKQVKHHPYRSTSPSELGFESKIKCLDCEKVYKASNLAYIYNMQRHLEKDKDHAKRVEARVLREAPVDDLMERVAKIQQALGKRKR